MIDTAGGSTSMPGVEVAIPTSTSPTAVNLPCPCPGHPHPFDTVVFHEGVTNLLGMAVGAVLRRNVGDDLGMQAELGMAFLRFGIDRWTFADRSGPVEVTAPIPAEIIERWLPFADGGMEAIEVANRLYGEEVFRPFVRRSMPRSPVTPTTALTSATTDSGRTPRKHSKRSSPVASDGKLSVVRAR